MNWHQLSHLSSEELFKLQSKKFLNFIKYQVPYHPFYRQLFKTHTLSASDFRSIHDIRKIPFTNKTDLAPTPEDRQSVINRLGLETELKEKRIIDLRK